MVINDRARPPVPYQAITDHHRRAIIDHTKK
jgi:hypothetical protein